MQGLKVKERLLSLDDIILGSGITVIGKTSHVQEKDRVIASGFLVGPDILVTSAHVFLDEDLQTDDYISNVGFFHPYSGKTSLGVRDYWYDTEADIAVIKLNTYFDGIYASISSSGVRSNDPVFSGNFHPQSYPEKKHGSAQDDIKSCAEHFRKTLKPSIFEGTKSYTFIDSPYLCFLQLFNLQNAKAGNSGSAIFNEKGEVVSIVTAKIDPQRKPQVMTMVRDYNLNAFINHIGGPNASRLGWAVQEAKGQFTRNAQRHSVLKK